MSTALTAQPGLHRATRAISAKAKVKGKNKKRKKSTMAGGACATAAMGRTKNKMMRENVNVFIVSAS